MTEGGGKRWGEGGWEWRVQGVWGLRQWLGAEVHVWRGWRMSWRRCQWGEGTVRWWGKGEVGQVERCDGRVCAVAR